MWIQDLTESLPISQAGLEEGLHPPGRLSHLRSGRDAELGLRGRRAGTVEQQAATARGGGEVVLRDRN